MRVTHIGHASLLVETGGITLLSDPWWRGPCFGAQWWIHPDPYLRALEGRRIDYLYISHGHHDHFHPGTLSAFNRDTRVLVSGATGLAPFVRQLGFEVIELDDDQAFPLGPAQTSCRVIETIGGDTLIAIADAHEVCVNLNDSLHSAPDDAQDRFVRRLRELYPVIDYVFCGYGVASHFPNCYVMPGKDRVETAVRRQHYFNGRWVRIMAALQPRFAFPFAADVIFLEDDLFWVNEATHNVERPTDLFRTTHPSSAVNVLDIAPGFVIERGEVAREVLRVPLSGTDIRSHRAAEVARANRYGSAAASAVEETRAMLQRSVDLSAAYLRSYDDSYRFLITFRNSRSGIAVEKARNALSTRVVSLTSDEPDAGAYDIVYTTRLAYVRSALGESFGNEILFVGSGGIFEYRRRPAPGENLNRELIHLLKHRDAPVASRYGRSPRPVVRTKRMLKRLVKREPPDLYDVAAWTVFAEEDAQRQ